MSPGTSNISNYGVQPRFCLFAEEHGKSITAVALTALAFLAVGGACLYFRASPLGTASGFIIGGGLACGDLFAAIALYQEKEVDPLKAAKKRFLKEFHAESDPEKKQEDQFSLSSYFQLLYLEEENKNHDIIREVLEIYIKNHPGEALFQDHLESVLQKLLASLPKQPKMRGRNYDLGDGTTLVRHYTGADGSCLFHGMVGEPNDRGVYRCNAKMERARFCKDLQKKADKGELPEEIATELLDHAIHSGNLPFTINDEETVQIISELASEKSRLTEQTEIEEKNGQLSDALFPSYLKYLSNTATYLTHPEAIAVAKFYEKTLVLYQPEGKWNNGSTKLGCDTFNEQEDQESIIIYYNGHNHYERAFIEPNRK
ncbi:MAG: hypothetical protein K940chlam9_00790 [Chlamydiae bacterium]|nr:hypothetical protein [Chlamydiota bacterium]